MISFLKDTNYEPIKTKRCSTIYKNSNKLHPMYVEVYGDDSWAAYKLAPHCVPERTGNGRDSFYSAYPDAITTKKPLYATIEYKSADHVGFLFGNELFQKESGKFPRLDNITNIIRDLTDMNNTQVVEFMSQLNTNTPYEIRVVRNVGLLYALEGRGFTVTH